MAIQIGRAWFFPHPQQEFWIRKERRAINITHGGINSVANAGSPLGLSPPQFTFPPEYKEHKKHDPFLDYADHLDIEPLETPQTPPTSKEPQNVEEPLVYVPLDEKREITAKVIFTVKFYRNKNDANSGRASQDLNEQKLFENTPAKEPVINATNGELGFANQGEINFNYPTKFLGWYDLENDQKWNFKNPPQKDLNLYAKWKKTFSVALYLSSEKLKAGKDAPYIFPALLGEKLKKIIPQENLTNQEAGFADPNDPNASYSAQFSAWFKDDGDDDFTNDTPWDFDNDTVTENTKLYVTWEETFNIKLYLTKRELKKNKTLTNKKYSKGTKITQPTLNNKTNENVLDQFSPQNASYPAKLSAWFKDDGDNDFTNDTPWDFDNDTVTENTKLYATWEETFFIIKLYRNKNDIKNKKINPFSLILVTNSGKAKKPTSPKSTTQYVKGDKCFTAKEWKDEQDNIWNFNNRITGHVNLYATWNKNFYVTFYLTDEKTRAGEKLDQPIHNFTRYTDPGKFACPAEKGRQLVAEGTRPTLEPHPNHITNEDVGIIQPGDFGAGENASFIGWYNFKDAKPWIFPTDTVTEGLKLYGKWAATSEVTFYLEKDSPSPLTTPAKKLIFQQDPENPTINNGLIADPGPMKHTNPSYTFKGWEYETTTAGMTVSQPWDFSKKTTADSIKIYATWDKRHHVSFYKTKDNTKSSSATGYFGDSHAEKVIRVEDGHTLTRSEATAGIDLSYTTNYDAGLLVRDYSDTSSLGRVEYAHFDDDDQWINAANDQPWDFNTPITGNVKLYPDWKETFDVKFYKTKGDYSLGNLFEWAKKNIIKGDKLGALPSKINIGSIKNKDVGFAKPKTIVSTTWVKFKIVHPPNAKIPPTFLGWIKSTKNTTPGSSPISSPLTSQEIGEIEVTESLEFYGKWEETFTIKLDIPSGGKFKERFKREKAKVRKENKDLFKPSYKKGETTPTPLFNREKMLKMLKSFRKYAKDEQRVSYLYEDQYGSDFPFINNFLYRQEMGAYDRRPLLLRSLFSISYGLTDENSMFHLDAPHTVNKNITLKPLWVLLNLINILDGNKAYREKNILTLPLNPPPSKSHESSCGSGTICKPYFKGWHFHKDLHMPTYLEVDDVDPTVDPPKRKSIRVSLTEARLEDTKYPGYDNDDNIAKDSKSFPKYRGTYKKGDAAIFDLWQKTEFQPMSKSELKGLLHTNPPELYKIDISLIKDLSELFKDTIFSSSFEQNKSEIIGWNLEEVTNMENMFENSDFNQPIWGWNTGKVTNMRGMFRNATQFNQNLSTWDMSLVTNMVEMFKDATDFNQDMKHWNWRPSCNIRKKDVKDMFAGTPIENDDTKLPIFYRQLQELSQDEDILKSYKGNIKPTSFHPAERYVVFHRRAMCSKKAFQVKNRSKNSPY